MPGLTGDEALRRRLNAIKDTSELLTKVALLGVAEAKKLVPVKTRNLSRTIRVGKVTEKSAQVIAGGTSNVGYARYVEEGTGIYGPRKRRIVPVNAKALRWIGGPAGSLRLSGAARKGKAGAGAGPIFARSVAGRRATPFFLPGVRTAIGKAGLGDIITTNWNEAA